MTESAVIVDQFGRRLRNLRISVTDRCNLRCNYCMPEEEYAWLPREDILSFEEIGQLVDVFVDLGVDKVRLTGGEPLLRKDLPRLVAMLAARPGLADLAMTTNGVLLAEHAPALRAPGSGSPSASTPSAPSGSGLSHGAIPTRACSRGSPPSARRDGRGSRSTRW